jgi:beta-exotoxin I transport system ATP-binding protein
MNLLQTDRSVSIIPVMTTALNSATADRLQPASGPARATALEATRLGKRFGDVHAVTDVTFAVEAGEIVGFLGPNGAGKTTTMRMFMGFIAPSAGRCSVLGGSLRAEPALRRRVGYLPGDFRMDGAMSGADLFRWFGRLRGGVDPRRVDELCERFDLDPRRPFRDLSKGNRQKIGIVQAFMHDPDVLILDEPTSGLDPLVQRTFLDLVREVAARGAAVLFSSHVLSEVERLASRVAIIREGRLATVGGVEQLMDRARHRLELRFAEPVADDLFKDVPGVVEQRVDGRTVTITIDGPVGPAMRVAASGPTLLRVSPAADELEEMFADLYDPGRGRDA